MIRTNYWRLLLASKTTPSRYQSLTAIAKEQSDCYTSCCSYSSLSQQVSTKNDDEVTEASLSKRREFLQIPVHPSILRYIETIGVGIPSRKGNNTQRRMSLVDNRAKVASGTQPKFLKPPQPFGEERKPQIVGSVGVGDVIKIDNNKQSPIDALDNRDSDVTHVVDNDFLVNFPTNNSSTPEIALAGRSNVGKSTLLNSLLYGSRNNSMSTARSQRGRRRMDCPKLPKGVKANVSNRPGETRSITFYQLQSSHRRDSDNNKSNAIVETHRIRLVDLPGYGFAYASEQDSLEYQKLLTEYILFRGASLLKRLLILIDSRHGMKKADIDFLTMLQEQERIHNAVHVSPSTPKQRKNDKRLGGSNDSYRKAGIPPIQVVLTKCDLVQQADLARRVSQVRQQLANCFVREPNQLPVMLVSARYGVGNVEGGGVLQLQKELAALAQPSRSESEKTS